MLMSHIGVLAKQTWRLTAFCCDKDRLHVKHRLVPSGSTILVVFTGQKVLEVFLRWLYSHVKVNVKPVSSNAFEFRGKSWHGTHSILHKAPHAVLTPCFLQSTQP